MPNRSRWLVALSVLLVGLVVVIAIAAAHWRLVCFRPATKWAGRAGAWPRRSVNLRQRGHPQIASVIRPFRKTSSCPALFRGSRSNRLLPGQADPHLFHFSLRSRCTAMLADWRPCRVLQSEHADRFLVEAVGKPTDNSSAPPLCCCMADADSPVDRPSLAPALSPIPLPRWGQ